MTKKEKNTKQEDIHKNKNSKTDTKTKQNEWTNVRPKRSMKVNNKIKVTQNIKLDKEKDISN